MPVTTPAKAISPMRRGMEIMREMTGMVATVWGSVLRLGVESRGWDGRRGRSWTAGKPGLSTARCQPSPHLDVDCGGPASVHLVLRHLIHGRAGARARQQPRWQPKPRANKAWCQVFEPRCLHQSRFCVLRTPSDSGVETRRRMSASSQAVCWPNWHNLCLVTRSQSCFAPSVTSSCKTGKTARPVQPFLSASISRHHVTPTPPRLPERLSYQHWLYARLPSRKACPDLPKALSYALQIVDGGFAILPLEYVYLISAAVSRTDATRRVRVSVHMQTEAHTRYNAAESHRVILVALKHASL